LDSLIVNNVNVLTEIANKASTSSLSSYVLTSALTTALNSKLSITDPKLTQTAVAWTSNSVDSDGVTSNDAHHYINTGTDALTIKVDSSTISASFFGPLTGTSKGNVLFNKSVQVLGTLKVGSVNIIDELATQINNSNLAALALKESPIFTGTGTASNFTVTNNLLIGTTNVLTNLNKQN
jgi:hypothetical protein